MLSTASVSRSVAQKVRVQLATLIMEIINLSERNERCNILFLSRGHYDFISLNQIQINTRPGLEKAQLGME